MAVAAISSGNRRIKYQPLQYINWRRRLFCRFGCSRYLSQAGRPFKGISSKAAGAAPNREKNGFPVGIMISPTRFCGGFPRGRENSRGPCPQSLACWLLCRNRGKSDVSTRMDRDGSEAGGDRLRRRNDRRSVAEGYPGPFPQKLAVEACCRRAVLAEALKIICCRRCRLH